MPIEETVKEEMSLWFQRPWYCFPSSESANNDVSHTSLSKFLKPVATGSDTILRFNKNTLIETNNDTDEDITYVALCRVLVPNCTNASISSGVNHLDKWKQKIAEAKQHNSKLSGGKSPDNIIESIYCPERYFRLSCPRSIYFRVIYC
jgi:hypothetical protein